MSAPRTNNGNRPERRSAASSSNDSFPPLRVRPEMSIEKSMPYTNRHARAWPAYPRGCTRKIAESQAWMAGSSPLPSGLNWRGRQTGPDGSRSTDVIPASEPGSNASGGVFRLPTLDPGSEAGMTSEMRSMVMRQSVTPCIRPTIPCPARSEMPQSHAPIGVTGHSSELNRTVVDQVRP